MGGKVPGHPSSRLLAKATIEIPEVRYKADRELHDRYPGFSVAGVCAVGMSVAGLLLAAHSLPPLVQKAG